MFEFLVITILVGVLFAVKNLFSRVGALSHESDVLKRRLDSLRQDLTGVTVALRARASGETIPGEGRKVHLEAIAELDRRLNELVERLKSPTRTPDESGATDRDTQVHPSPPPLPEEEAVPVSTAKEAEPVVPEPGPPVPIPDESRIAPAAVPVHPPQQPHRPRPPQRDLPPVFDWESFTGVKLFAWLGGVALFLGAAFFVKYSIEHSLISPILRIILGLLAGSGLLAGGMWMRRQGYETTVHTLCASGIAILYVDIFAAHSFYDFIPPTPAFLLMALVTLAAFLLAVRLDGRYIAVLGLVGGFLTPPLLSTGVDRPLGLFSYVALLDTGLVAVAWRKRWGFLVSLSAVGTLAMQVGWAEKFFEVSKALTGCVIFLVFPLFYLAVSITAGRRKLNDRWVDGPGFVLPLLSMGFAAYMLGFPELAAKPGLVFSFAFLLGSALTGTALLRQDYRPVHAIGGSLAFLMLLYWTADALTLELLPWALGFYLLFAGLHAAFPIVLQRLQPEPRPFAWVSIFPVLMLLPMLIAIGRDLTHSLFIWPALFAVNGIVLLAALASAAVWTIAIALLLTLSSAALWLHHSPGIEALPGFLGIVALSALFFFAVGMFLSSRRPAAAHEPASTAVRSDLQHLPALSAVLPFLLLILASAELPLARPAPVFGLALLLSVLLLGLVHYRQVDAVFPAAAGSVALLLYAWHADHFDASQPMLGLPWYLFFCAFFTAFPFLFHKRLQERPIPWVAAALSAPAYFFLVHRAVARAFGTAYIGLLPVLFAIVYLTALVWIVRHVPGESEIRATQLACFGGVALFFISLAFPLQFDKEWITLGWALEGTALVWLFQRVPHPGLKIWALALLALAFVRLAVNPAVIEYHPRTAVPILNWYLYAYGVTALCFGVAARLWRPKEQRLFQWRIPSLMIAMATVLAFLLLNIEIADCFSSGDTLTFQFSRNFAQDMTYSLAWALFAFLLLLAGVKWGSRGARFASLGLLLATAVKVFLHDLWQLGQLYRVVSLVGLAVFLIVVSFLYQRFVSPSTPSEEP